MITALRRKFLNAYRNIALLLFNTFVLFMLLNVLLLTFFWIRDSVTADPVKKPNATKLVPPG